MGSSPLSLYISLFVFAAALFRSQVAVAQLPFSHCNWVQNLTDTVELAGHKYVILEECLYYNLTDLADKSQGKHNALITLPPTRNAGDKIKITVRKLTIRQLWINEIWKEMNVAGHFDILWKDWRMHWEPSKWKVSSIPIKSYGHIWVPDLKSGAKGRSGQSNDFTVFKNIRASHDGIMTTKLDYRIQARCNVDYANYPSDERTCCFSLSSEGFDSMIELDLETQNGVIQEASRTNWEVPEIKMIPDPKEPSSMKVCVRAGRKSSTLKIELTVPMVISAILVIISPLFGPFKQQLYVKLFAILLQFMCFQFLVSKTPQVGFGDNVPKIYRFYEFTVGTTLLSLLITLVINALSRVERALPPSTPVGPHFTCRQWIPLLQFGRGQPNRPRGGRHVGQDRFYEFTVGTTLLSLLITLVINALSRVERALPPPHRLGLISSAVNGYLCCNSEEVNRKDPEGAAAGSHAREWSQVFACLNNAMSVVLMVVYVLGVLVLCS